MLRTWRALAAPILVALATLAAPGAARDAIDLLNLALSPELTGWLVGANARLATKAEEKEYLALPDDAAAQAFIDRFWETRDPDPARPGNPVRDLAERRAEDADRRFTEATYAGRRTDRGTIYVLYGEPEKIEHEPGDFKGEPPVEVWTYPKSAGPGLDGKKPEPRYRFVERGDLTVFYLPGIRTRRPEAGTPFS
jgi:GWxTD domain-containing protein